MKVNFNLKGLLASAFLMLSVSLSAQQHTVTGTVVDSATAEENDITTYIPDVVKFGTR